MASTEEWSHELSRDEWDKELDRHVHDSVAEGDYSTAGIAIATVGQEEAMGYGNDKFARAARKRHHRTNLLNTRQVTTNNPPASKALGISRHGCDSTGGNESTYAGTCHCLEPPASAGDETSSQSSAGTR